jgi:hypothetical protein
MPHSLEITVIINNKCCLLLNKGGESCKKEKQVVISKLTSALGTPSFWKLLLEFVEVYYYEEIWNREENHLSVLSFASVTCIYLRNLRTPAATKKKHARVHFLNICYLANILVVIVFNVWIKTATVTCILPSFLYLTYSLYSFKKKNKK